MVSIAAGMLAAPLVRINEETVKRITPGLTLKEVEGVVGGPPGDYDGMEAHYVFSCDSGRIDSSDLRISQWTGLNGAISCRISFLSGQVVDADYCPPQSHRWSVWAFSLERLTRCPFFWLHAKSSVRDALESLVLRLLICAVIVVLVVVLSGRFISVARPNALGFRGMLGIALGLILFPVILWLISPTTNHYQSLLDAFAYSLGGAILGCLSGISLGAVRRYRAIYGPIWPDDD
ncbi:MAG: hypothetical protein K8T25_10130 [Planctomycetia bacterium]|nr:hypothetical protein [Planctomycetia bacterium]